MKALLEKIFPKTINNDFTGQKIALFGFYILTAVTIWRSQHHLFSADGGAQSIATIPLDQLTEKGAAAVIGVFALWGLSQLIIGLIYLIVCLRYRSLVPLMYVLMFFEYLFRATYIPAFKPIPTIGIAPGAAGNLPFILLSLGMLVLSLMQPKIGIGSLENQG